jgi:hypothetical protein
MITVWEVFAVVSCLGESRIFFSHVWLQRHRLIDSTFKSVPVPVYRFRMGTHVRFPFRDELLTMQREYASIKRKASELLNLFIVSGLLHDGKNFGVVRWAKLRRRRVHFFVSCSSLKIKRPPRWNYNITPISYITTRHSDFFDVYPSIGECSKVNYFG